MIYDNVSNAQSGSLKGKKEKEGEEEEEEEDVEEEEEDEVDTDDDYAKVHFSVYPFFLCIPCIILLDL